MSESTGTITVTNGSASVTGSGTLFATNFCGPDDLLIVDGLNYVIKSVTSDTALTLTRPYTGTTASGKTYEIIRTTGEKALNELAQKVAELVNKYGTTVNSITDTPGASKIPRAGSDGKLDDGWFKTNQADGLLKLDSSGKAPAAQLPDSALAPRENLLHNWDFRKPVNQRGESEYSTTRKYTIDRWFMISGSGKITKASGGVTVNGSAGVIYFVQPLEYSAGLAGKTVTLSAALASGGGRMGIYTGMDIFATTNVAGSKTLSGAGTDSIKITLPSSISGYICVYFACNSGESMTLERVKLEIGKSSTLDSSAPMDYGKELEVCRRYCTVLASDFRSRMVSYGSSYMDALFPLSAQMRATPSVESGGVVLCSLTGGENSAEISVLRCMGYSNGLWLRANTSSAHGMTDGFIKVKSGGLVVSADI